MWSILYAMIRIGGLSEAKRDDVAETRLLICFQQTLSLSGCSALLSQCSYFLSSVMRMSKHRLLNSSVDFPIKQTWMRCSLYGLNLTVDLMGSIWRHHSFIPPPPPPLPSLVKSHATTRETQNHGMEGNRGGSSPPWLKWREKMLKEAVQEEECAVVWLHRYQGARSLFTCCDPGVKSILMKDKTAGLTCKYTKQNIWLGFISPFFYPLSFYKVVNNS